MNLIPCSKRELDCTRVKILQSPSLEIAYITVNVYTCNLNFTFQFAQIRCHCHGLWSISIPNMIRSCPRVDIASPYGHKNMSKVNGHPTTSTRVRMCNNHAVASFHLVTTFMTIQPYSFLPILEEHIANVCVNLVLPLNGNRLRYERFPYF